MPPASNSAELKRNSCRRPLVPKASTASRNSWNATGHELIAGRGEFFHSHPVMDRDGHELITAPGELSWIASTSSWSAVLPEYLRTLVLILLLDGLTVQRLLRVTHDLAHETLALRLVVTERDVARHPRRSLCIHHLVQRTECEHELDPILLEESNTHFVRSTGRHSATVFKLREDRHGNTANPSECLGREIHRHDQLRHVPRPTSMQNSTFVASPSWNRTLAQLRCHRLKCCVCCPSRRQKPGVRRHGQRRDCHKACNGSRSSE